MTLCHHIFHSQTRLNQKNKTKALWLKILCFFCFFFNHVQIFREQRAEAQCDSSVCTLNAVELDSVFVCVAATESQWNQEAAKEKRSAL